MRKIIASFLLLTFIADYVLPPSWSQVALPQAAGMVELSPAFHPPVLTGVKVYAKDPFRFDFILERGDTSEAVSQSSEDSLGPEPTRLIKYFLASLTVPARDLWVNLSPYEKDRIVPETFGRTEMGRDLLAQDYLLKQITSSLMYPEGETGKVFWNEIYRKAREKFGTTNIPVDSFNKVWIVPAKAQVYERVAGLGDRKAGEAVAYVTESRLKVMLESDYLAESSSQGQPSASAAVSSVGRTQTADNKDARELSKQIIREVIIPALEKEVNEGKNFAALRQVYNSLILAAWYKQKVVGSFQASPLGFYLDRQKVTGVNIDDPKEAEKIWGRYVEAFKKGAYNYIREEYDPLTQEMLPRKYFAGGLGLVNVKPETDGRLTSEQLRRKDKAMVSMRVDPAQRDNDNKLEEALGTNILTILNHQQVADFLGTKGKVAKAPFSGSSKLVLPSGSTVYVDHPKVLPEQEERWRVWDTSIAKMEQDFKDVLPNQSIVTEVVRLANIRNKQGKKLVYLDWGCGNASALVGLKEKLLQAGVNNVVLVGFADNWTDSWLDLPRDINIIFGTVDQLQDQLNTNKDLFPDGKVDVVGSYYGIQHLHVADLDAYTSHLKFLAQRLGKNGFIVMDSLIGKAATNVYFLTQIFTTVVTGKGSSGTVLPIFLSGPRSTDSAQSRPSGISILGQVVAQVGGKFQLVNVVRFRNKPGRQAIAKAMREQWASGNASSVSSSTTLAKLLATLDQDDAIARSIDFYAAESPDGQLLAVLPVKKARSSNNEDIVAFMHWIAQPGQLEVVRQLLFMVVNQLHEAGGKLVDVDARDVFGFPELNPGATARERQRGAKYSGMQPILQYVKDRTLGELFSALTKDGFINKGDILSLPKGKQVLDRLIKKGIVEDKYDLRVRLNKEWEAQERDIQAIINNVYRSEDEEQRISNLKNLRKVFRRAQQDMVAAESARQVLEQWLQEGFMLQPGESPEVDRIRIQKKLSNGSGRKLSIKGSIERVALRMFQDLLAGKVIVQKADGTYGLAEVLKLSKMSDKDRQQFEAALGRQSNNPAILQGAKQTEVILLKEYLAGSPVVKKGDLNTDLFIELITKGNRTVDQLLKIKILAMAEKPVKPSEQDIIKVVNEVLRDPNLARYLTDVSNVKLPINIIDADIVSKNRVFFERAYEGVFQNSFVSNKSLPKDLDLYAAVERDAKGSIRVLAIDYIKVPEKMTLSMGKQMVFFNESALVSENLAAYKLQDMDSPDKDAALYEASRQILRKLLSSLSVFLTADFRKPGEPFNNSMVKDVLEVLKGAGFIVPEISPTMLDIDRLNGLIASEDFRSQLKEAIYTGHTPNGDVITLPPSLSLEAILGPIEFNPQEFSSLDEIQKIADTIPKGPRFSSQERAVQWLKGPQLFEIYAELARSNKLEATQIDSINKVANMLSKRSRELLNWGYEFQAVEFESSEPLKNVEYLPLDVIEPLLTGLGLPANKFNDITAAVRWLNDSIEPFEKYISRMRVAGGADETISKLLPKNFVDLSTDELRKLAKTNEGRELKRAILTILYPDVTPKILNKRIKLATTWEGTYLKRVLLEVLFKHPMSTSEIIGRASLSRSNARAIILHNFFVTEFTSGELVPDELQKVAVKEKPSGMLREEIARVTATPSDQLPAQISARDWAKVLNNLMNNSGLPEYLQTDRRLFLSEEMLEKMDRAKTGAGRPLSGIELRALNKSLLKKQIFISECFKDKSPRIRNVSAAEERSALEILGLLQEQNTELVLYSGGDHILDKLNVSAPDAKNTSTGGDFAQLSGKKDMSELDDDALREIGKAWKDEALARIFIHDAKKFLFPLSGSVQDALFELDKLTADQEISLEGLNHSITILTSTIELLLAQAHETNDALARGRIVAQYVKECVSEIDALEQDFRDQPLALEGINIFNEQYSFDQFKDVFRRMLSNEVYRQALNLDSLLGGIVNQVNFGSHNVKIIKEWQPVSRWDYSGDDIHLTMAFLNLVVNSIESMDAVTGRDRVLTIKADISADGNAAIIKISDTGKGISADKLPLIGQLGNTFGKENGNGIGVYSARTIVEAHGGQLGIESVEGQGTTFTVTLPRLAQDSAQSAFQQIVDESGGVNFTPEKMNLQTQGAGAISFDFDPAQLARFESAPGVVPVIIGVRPAVDLPSFLGLSNAGAAGSGA